MKNVDEWVEIYKEIWNRYKGNCVRLTLGQFSDDDQWAYIEIIEFANRSLDDFKELIKWCEKYHLRISMQNYSEVRLYEDYEEDLSNSSPPVRTSDKSDSAKAEEFNMGLEVPTSSPPKSPSATSPNPNIKRNFGFCSRGIL